MNSRRQPVKRMAFSLVELLLVMALGIMLVGAAYRVVYLSWSTCRESTRQAWRNQEISLFRKRWRSFVHSLPATGWTMTDGTFRAGSDWAAVSSDKLVLCARQRRAEVVLPRGMEAGLTLEQAPGRADCAVLTMSWQSRFLRRTREHAVHIVACAPSDSIDTRAAREDRAVDTSPRESEQ